MNSLEDFNTEQEASRIWNELLFLIDRKSIETEENENKEEGDAVEAFFDRVMESYSSIQRTDMYLYLCECLRALYEHRFMNKQEVTWYQEQLSLLLLDSDESLFCLVTRSLSSVR